MRRRAQSFRYLLAIHLMRSGEYSMTLSHLTGVLAADPAVGLYFARETKDPFKKMISLIKPYGAYFAALVMPLWKRNS